MCVCMCVYIQTHAQRGDTHGHLFVLHTHIFQAGGIEANMAREITAGDHGAHHHLTYGHFPGHREAAGVLPCAILRGVARDACSCLLAGLAGTVRAAVCMLLA